MEPSRVGAFFSRAVVNYCVYVGGEKVERKSWPFFFGAHFFGGGDFRSSDATRRFDHARRVE